MSSNIVASSLLLVTGVFIASVAQVLLKKSALIQREIRIRDYLNGYVLLAYALMFGSTLLSLLAYRALPLSLGMLLDATGYIFVTLFGALFFHEKITKKRLLALGMILSGIVVYAVCG